MTNPFIPQRPNGLQKESLLTKRRICAIKGNNAMGKLINELFGKLEFQDEQIDFSKENFFGRG